MQKLRASGQIAGITLSLAAALLSGQTHCAETADLPSSQQVWINPGLYSYHFDRSKNFRENNIGVGVQWLFAINSDRARSRYVAYQWQPLHWQPAPGLDVNAGVVVGAFDGYPFYRNGGWFIAPLPMVAVEGKRVGVNFSVVPNYGNRLHGALVLQLKLRVW
jgi:hypothetical protein